MKYWRGFLVALIFGGFSWALMDFAKNHTSLIDVVYPYVTRMIQDLLADWSGSVAFCLWQVLALVLIVGVLASIVLMIVLRWNPIQVIGWYTAVASLLFFAHTAIYGLNGSAGPLAEDIRLNITEFTVREMEEAAVYYRDKANELASQINRDAEGKPQYPDFQTLAEQAGEGFTSLVYDSSYSVFAGSTVPVKELGWADMYTSMGITGVTMPLTGEAAVNPQIPVVSMPFTMCHEMAHRMTISKEDDANMAAFLACQANPRIEFQYSAYFMAYRYCYNGLVKLGTADSQAAAKRVHSGVSEDFYYDLWSYDSFFAARRDESAAKVATTTNNAYINVSGDERGVEAYDDVSKLLVSWHIQTVVLPTQMVEDTKFDPYDENQVDLFGYVNGPEVVVPTEGEDADDAA